MIWKTFVALLFIIAGCSSIEQVKVSSNDSFSFDNRKVLVYTTAEKTNLRLAETGRHDLTTFEQPLETEVAVFVNPLHTFQTFLGIGGALTDASAETFAKLPADKQEELLRAYYSSNNGIGYTLARTNINSCDFSSASYTYVNDKDDNLNSFSIEQDRKFKIPFIKRARQMAGEPFNLYVSPWSPPAWMKDNGNMLQGGKLLPLYRNAWANYFVKFINAYESEGIPVWGLSVQNEPMAKQRWESCIFTAEEERDFIKMHLGPALQKAGLGNKKLIAWDHNRDLVLHRAGIIYDDPEAAKYVWGIGYHWYETWTGSKMQHDNIKAVAAMYPGKNLIFTEGAIEKFSFDRINDWTLGEKYGSSMINDFNSGTVGWTDWNVLLDETGGPNHVGNFCFAPVIADTRNGSLHYTNIYYYIGHFSKFIKPGAKRIASGSNRDKLQVTAFINPDSSIIVVIMNNSEENIKYKLNIADKGLDVESLPRSISTIVVQ
jgi:glucosylceramidase